MFEYSTKEEWYYNVPNFKLELKSVNYYLSQLQYNSDSKSNNIEEEYENEEEEVRKNIPKPVQLQQNKVVIPMESKDIRNKNNKPYINNSNPNSASNLSGSNYKQYIPDIDAYKIVDDIINKRK